MNDDTSQDEKAPEVDLNTEDLVDDLAPPDLDEEVLDEEVLDEEVLDEEVLDADVDGDLDGDLDDETVLDGEVIELDTITEVLVDPAAAVAERVGESPRAKRSDDDDDEVVDLDEELHPDDVETPLDALLEEKTASAKMEDDEEELEEEEPEGAEPGDGPSRIAPRRPTEFHCSSCFLLLPRSQLADEEKMLCRDCV